MVGLTGGIGSGKSTVSARLKELGAVIIDSDVLAREVVGPGTEGLAEIAAEFGPSVLTDDGSLDRPALGRIVFDRPEARARLESIIHPRVRARTVEIAAAAPDDAVVINDVPLLVEAGLAGGYELVIVVVADAKIRLQRLVSERGLTEADARARIAAQATDAQRREVADIVIINESTREALIAEVDELWKARFAT